MATKAKETAVKKTAKKETVKKVTKVTKEVDVVAKKTVKAEKKVIPKKVVKLVKELKKAVIADKVEKKVSVKKAAVKKTSREDEVDVEKVEVKTPVKVAPDGTTTIEELFEAGAHFGHVVKKWNPKMNRYLWGAKNGIHIFDLEKTFEGLNVAAKDLAEMAAEGKRIVLVGTKRQAKLMIEEEAKRLEVPYITQRWMGGLITNWKQIKLTLDRLNSLKQQREAGQLKKYTKKEQVMFDREISKLEREIGGIANMKEAPQVVVVFDTHKEKLAVKEASSRGVTVFGMVDSNANPDPVDYVIPMNDDSARGLEIVISVLGNAIEKGLKRNQELNNNSKTQDNKN